MPISQLFSKIKNSLPRTAGQRHPNESKPDDEWRSRLGTALQDRDIAQDSEQHVWYETWLANPSSLDGLLCAGRLSEWLGHTEWARHFLQCCLEIAPDNLPANSRLGLFLTREQKWSEAISYLAKAVTGASPNEVCLSNLGQALFMAGEEHDALMLLQRAWDKDPGSDILARALFYVALRSGNACVARQVAEAVNEAHLRTVSEPTLVAAGGQINFFTPPSGLWQHIAFAQLATQSGDYPKAAELYRQLLTTHPDLAHSGQGAIAIATGDFADALEHFTLSIAAAAHPSAQMYFNRAKALIALSRHEEALTDLQHALDIQPDFTAAKFERGIVELRRGNWETGWQEYETRRQWAPDNLFNFFDSTAEWHGEPLKGKTIILVGEQGQGDVIQFVRFAGELADSGAEVIVCCAPSLARLAKKVPGVAHVFSDGEVIPPYDYWAPLASVPLLIKLRLETLQWHGPYVAPAAEESVAWQQRLARFTGMRIGLVWAGNDYRGQIWGPVYGRRNLSITEFLPLIRLPGTHCFSLQKGAAREQLNELQDGDRPIDFADEWGDFLDTAAFVANLDLVITVDTSVAHLAGAMGKPVWILSRTDGCWRWMDRREDSPWYPSARIFHQGIGESWPQVIERVCQALSDCLATGHLVPTRDASTGSPAAIPQKNIVDLDPVNSLVHGRHGWFLANRYDAYLGRALVRYGEYGEIEHRFLAALIAPGDCVVEVGANIGSHTVGMAKTVGREGMVIAIEAQPAIYRVLCTNLTLNSLSNVVTHACGCGNEAGTMYAPAMDYNKAVEHNSGGISLHSTATGIPVPIATLDSLLADIGRISLIKIDVEGMELSVLQGAHETLKQHRPILYVENDRVEKSRALIEHLLQEGYRLWWHIPPLFNPDNYFHIATNDYGTTASFNMVCLPQEAAPGLFSRCNGLQEIFDPELHPLRST